jgi:hypothetical protein
MEGGAAGFGSARPPGDVIHGGAIMLSMMVATFTLLSAALVNYWDQRKHR